MRPALLEASERDFILSVLDESRVRGQAGRLNGSVCIPTR